MVILLVDIGNTDITVGLYDEGIRDILRIKTLRESGSGQEYSLLVKDLIRRNRIGHLAGVVMCSVVPEQTPLVREALRMSVGLEPLRVSHILRTGLTFCVTYPESLGEDRIANAVAAHRLYGGDAIVIDFGTATTFSVVSRKGEYLGGVIMPGLGMSAEALAQGASQLPKIKLTVPERVIGDDTAGNMLSGLILGHEGAVGRIVKGIKRELSVSGNSITGKKGREAINVIATGGYAHLIAPRVAEIGEINAHLTLEGLRIIFELNVR